MSNTLRPLKDRYNPDNTYRILIQLSNHPGAKWVSFKDKETGEVTKGVFLPDVNIGGVRVKRGKIKFEVSAIPVKGLEFTHLLISPDSTDVDCGLGSSERGYYKPILGVMYVVGETLNKTKLKLLNKYARRKTKFRISSYKKD